MTALFDSPHDSAGKMTSHDLPAEIATLAEALRFRATHRAEDTAFIFLGDGEHEESRMTYRELDTRACAIAAALRVRCGAGERALLVLPSGLDFMAAIFGCMYAGIVAVPAYPPRHPRNFGRLRAIAGDARPAIALCTAAMSGKLGQAAAECGLDGLDWLPVDALHPAAEWNGELPSADAIAFLQYTSGSTAQPKGVMVTHSALLANHRMILNALGDPHPTTVVSWMPLFHDMGLIGNALHAVYLGMECVLMPAEAFLMKPVRWLQAISRYGVVQSGGPNFAYDLCVQRVTPEQRAGLNLAGWRDAFVGAEPVRAATLERFAAAFADCGFRREAFYPCYGLAEATLLVSGGNKQVAFLAVAFDGRALESHRAVEATAETDRVRTLTACGRSQPGGEIVIVDHETGAPCADNIVGEIWVSGPNVTAGYWNQPEATEQTFHAALADRPGKLFLRTGDLGFFHRGQLFIAGRLKDHIIIAGRNHHPGDIEHTIEKCHPAVRAGCCAAFPVDDGAQERLAVVVEIDRSWPAEARGEIVKSARMAVAEQHDLAIHRIALLKPAACPRTTSGKVMRQACRAGLLEGTLNTWESPS